MSAKYRFMATIVVAGILLVSIPVYGAVIVNNNVSVQTGHVEPFAYLTNNTSSLPASGVAVNQYGNEANVSLSGTWKLSATSQLKNVDGFVAQNLSRNVDASTYLEVSSLKGASNLTQLNVYLNQSNSPGQLEAEYSSGNLVQYSTPVSFSQSLPLNLSISFSPYTNSSKLIQYYHVSLSLILISHVNTAGSSAYIEETVNISITEQIF